MNSGTEWAGNIIGTECKRGKEAAGLFLLFVTSAARELHEQLSVAWWLQQLLLFITDSGLGKLCSCITDTHEMFHIIVTALHGQRLGFDPDRACYMYRVCTSMNFLPSLGQNVDYHWLYNAQSPLAHLSKWSSVSLHTTRSGKHLGTVTLVPHKWTSPKRERLTAYLGYFIAKVFFTNILRF